MEWIVQISQGDTAQQVRIDRSLTIRISPSNRMPRPAMLVDLPQQEVSPRMRERKTGHCVPVSGIAGVQVGSESKLILFMRDRRMLTAALEKSCRARDFYSGFLLQRTADGQLCAGRDMLLSRNGANCKVSKLRQLVVADE